MSFKDTINKDLTVFTNPLEMGSVHTINGKSAAMVVDGGTLNQKYSKDYVENQSSTITIYITVDGWLKVYPKIASVGIALEFDNMPYVVQDVRAENDGIYTLEIVRSGW